MISISVKKIGAIIYKLILPKSDKSILYDFFKSIGDGITNISSDIDMLKNEMEDVKSGTELEYISDSDIYSLF